MTINSVWYKLRAGFSEVIQGSGIKGKAATINRLFKLSLGSKFGSSFFVQDSIASELWSDFYLLRFLEKPCNVIRISRAEPVLWFMVPELDAKVFFGGYRAYFEFIRIIQARGNATGLIVLGPHQGKKYALQEFSNNPLVKQVIERCDFQSMGGVKSVFLQESDTLFAYNWTTAITAKIICEALRRPFYYYFVQEDERIFYQNDSFRFLIDSIFESSIEARLICNSFALREHFIRESKCPKGVPSRVFEQAVPDVAGASGVLNEINRPFKFGFYGRPEGHAKRNLMPVALSAIYAAATLGAFDGRDWEFYMVGSAEMGESFSLGSIEFKCLPPMGYDEYRREISKWDLALSLMYAPHPSVPPFEMVRSGTVTVVNASPGRSADWYKAISGNFEVGEATTDGLAKALIAGAERVHDVESRRLHANSHHLSTWGESFSDLCCILASEIDNFR